MPRTPKRTNSTKPPKLAEVADRYRCYQLSVQEPSHEVDFFVQVFKERFGRKPLHVREDFCGTFAVCCEWVKGHKDRTAVGVDLDSEPLDWGRAHNLSQLRPAQQQRVTLLQQDVCKRTRGKDFRPADVLAAQNFSFWLFKSRSEVVDYLRTARSHLADEGLIVMDMMGGSDCFIEGHEDVRRVTGYGKPVGAFRYVWEQARVDPITGEADFYISFRFKDGSELSRCFGYHWRFWSIPEVREMLHEAGFAESHVYWEVLDKKGRETGKWARACEAKNDASWIAYVVGVR